MEMIDHAIAYRRRGWSVVPCEPQGKQPLVRWTPFNEEPPTENQINEWWNKWPSANIAIICGKVSGIVVIDVDTKRGGEKQSQAPTSMVSKTGGGGYHLFYRYPNSSTRVPNRVGQDGIDVRADGGYIIAPPSTHRTGNSYRWLQEGEPAPCPRWVLEKKADTKEKPKNKWLVELLGRGSEPGSRNDDVARLSGYLASKDIPIDIAVEFVHQWMSNQSEPLSRDEIEVTTHSVYRTAKRNRQSIEKPFATIKMRDYVRSFGSTETEWLVDEWLPDSTIAFIASPPGGFKTWLTFDLAVSVASGLPFLNKAKVNKPGPVLVVQQEDYHGQVAERLATIELGKFKIAPPSSSSDEFDVPVIPDLPIYLHPDRRLRFDDATVLESLEQTIVSIKPRLIIIDPLYSAASTSDYMAGSAEDMFALKRMRDKYKCSFLIAHHTKKSAESWDRQNMWGSQFLNAFLETGWQIRKIEESNAVIIHKHFKSSGSTKHVKVTFDINTGSDYKYQTTVEIAREEETKRAVTKETSVTLATYLEALEDISPCTASELAIKMGKNKSSVGRILKKLEQGGEIEKRMDGKWVRVELPEF